MKLIFIMPRVVLLPVVASALALNLAAQQNPATFKVGDLAFTRPAKWEWVAVNSPMRKAQLKVTDADSKATAEVAFFQFGPGSGGGVQANVDRWLGQFTESRDKINSKVEETKVGKTKITYVQAEGTYKSGMPGTPQAPVADTALIGAIIETGPDDHIFVRMNGPKALVKASVEDFKKMIESGPKKD